MQLTDDAQLKALFEKDELKGKAAKGKDNFQILRNTNLFRAVLVGAGRFGVVYSVVMRVVRQYSLHEERRLTIPGAVPWLPDFLTWQTIRAKVNDPKSDLYRIEPPSKEDFTSRFLQIAICVIPHDNSTKNLASVTKRWNVPLALNPLTQEPSGRFERVGPVIEPFNKMIQGPVFASAGNSHIYTPDPNFPSVAADASFLEQACANANFLEGVIEAVIAEIKDFIDSNGEEIGFGLWGVAAAGGSSVVALIAALLIVLAILAEFLDWLASNSDATLGDALNKLKDMLLSEGEAGLLAWQMIAFEMFSSQQKDLDYSAISYAVMDKHDYFDQSCFVHPDAIEVFFDATDPMLLAFVDALLAFEIAQEMKGKSIFVGYIALRFTGPTQALLGEQIHPLTCVVEVAGLKDVTGVSELIDFAITLALDPNFKGILHWGQRNPSTRAQVQERFGDGLLSQAGDLHTWRDALSLITHNGKFDGFSNAFTRQTGLEIVTPKIGTLELVGATPPVGQLITIGWNCDENPPGTVVTLELAAPNAAPVSLTVLPVGQKQMTAGQVGTYKITLVVAITLGGETREATEVLSVKVA